MISTQTTYMGLKLKSPVIVSSSGLTSSVDNMALYEAADSLVSRDENIWAIVREQAGACFAGDRTAEEAARAIQSRVELYLNEQK